MSELLLCGRVTEHDGDIVSVCLWSVAEFVPIGSPEHRAMVEQRIAAEELYEDEKGITRVRGDRFADQPLRILPVETPESKLVGRAERARFWRWLVWALAGIWKGLAK